MKYLILLISIVCIIPVIKRRIWEPITFAKVRNNRKKWAMHLIKYKTQYGTYDRNIVPLKIQVLQYVSISLFIIFILL